MPKRKMPVSVVESPSEPQMIFSRKARESGLSQPANQSTTLDVQRIQNALRSAERGDTWLFFTIVRDMVASFSHLQAEWNKRKLVIVGQSMSLVPHDPNNEDDKIACEVIKEAVDNCRNWDDGLQHLLDATLYPISCAEKIFEPIGISDGSQYKYLKRYKLKEIAPIDYTLLCFKIPYLGTTAATNNPATKYDADQWESWLRFYKTEPVNGTINYSPNEVYSPDENIHIIHRGNLMSPSIPPNFGGHIRACLFLWLLATQDRDWWALMMQKYGMPIPVAKADSQNENTIQQLQSALALGMQLGGIVIDKKATIEWGSVAGTDGSNAHKIFSDFCNCEISKLVIGQVLSSTPKSTGMGSGASEQAEGVRDDIRQWDVTRLGRTLKYQLFKQILRNNGYKGNPPTPFWGGLSMGDAKGLGQTLQLLGAGGYELTDSGVVVIGEKLGYGIQRREIPDAMPNGANSPKK